MRYSGFVILLSIKVLKFRLGRTFSTTLAETSFGHFGFTLLPYNQTVLISLKFMRHLLLVYQRVFETGTPC
jgi:hypothetical protein